MAIIRASCPECGDIETTSDFTSCLVFRYPDGGELRQYRFRCPIDRQMVLKSTGQRTINILINRGVSVEYIDMPQQLVPQGLGQLTGKECIDFAVDLYTTKFDEELQRLDNNP